MNGTKQAMKAMREQFAEKRCKACDERPFKNADCYELKREFEGGFVAQVTCPCGQSLGEALVTYRIIIKN